MALAIHGWMAWIHRWPRACPVPPSSLTVVFVDSYNWYVSLVLFLPPRSFSPFPFRFLLLHLPASALYNERHSLSNFAEESAPCSCLSAVGSATPAPEADPASGFISRHPPAAISNAFNGQPSGLPAPAALPSSLPPPAGPPPPTSPPSACYPPGGGRGISFPVDNHRSAPFRLPHSACPKLPPSALPLPPSCVPGHRRVSARAHRRLLVRRCLVAYRGLLARP